MPKIQGIDNIISQKTTLFRGVVPVGGIIGIYDDRFAFLSGQVLPEGFQWCDGAAIPPGNTLIGNTPDLTGTKFLRGFTSSGNGPLNNSRAINLSQLPSHNHSSNAAPASLTHTHNSTSGVSDIASHNHTFNTSTNNAYHEHTMRITAGTGGPADRRSDRYSTVFGNYSNSRIFTGNSTAAGNMGHGHSLASNPANNAPHSHGLSTVTENVPHSHDAPSSGTGLGQQFSVTPVYTSAMFLIRVK